MEFFLTQLTSPMALVSSAIAALIVAKLFSVPFLLGGELVAAFFASWLLRPLAVLLIVHLSGVNSADGTATMYMIAGAFLGSTAFAAVGIVLYQFLKEQM